MVNTPSIWKDMPMTMKYYNYHYYEKRSEVVELLRLRGKPSVKEYEIWQ